MRTYKILLMIFSKILPNDLIYIISKYLNKKFILIKKENTYNIKQNRKDKYKTRHYFYK